MREVYIVALESSASLPLETLREAFEAEDVEFQPAEDGRSFSLLAEETLLDVRFDERESPMGWTPDLITGSDESHELLRKARGFYRIAFDAGQGQPSVAVFEALWCARALLEQAPGGVVLDVTAYKLHDPEDVADITELDFDIRDHVNLHAVEVTEGETPLWVHSHGMSKFGGRDVEVFHLGEPDLMAAESFLHELCTDIAFGQGPEPRREVGTSEGQTFSLVPSEEARTTLLGVSLDAFEGHDGLFLTVVSPLGRHNTAELLRPYRERFDKEPEERTEALRDDAQAHLSAFKARFLRKGLMEPLTFLVRASFDTHPEGEIIPENLWLEVHSWEEDTIVGKLVDGAVHTTEWRKGASVEIGDEQVNALALSREGRTLEEPEMRGLLLAERPA